jgi:hypothetical protein
MPEPNRREKAHSCLGHPATHNHSIGGALFVIRDITARLAHYRR